MVSVLLSALPRGCGKGEEVSKMPRFITYIPTRGTGIELNDFDEGIPVVVLWP